MQHLARCFLCTPWRRTSVPGLICEVSPYVGSSWRINIRGHLSAPNAAACFQGPPRVFYRTRRLVAHPSLQLARDPGLNDLIQTSDSVSDKRDHDAIFAALRTHLLQPEQSTRAIVDLLKQYFLRCSASTTLDLNPSERAILVEILRSVLDDWSRWEAATSSNYMSPVNILAFFARYGVLEPQDWAFCLNSLASTALEAFSSTDRKDPDQRLHRQFDAFLLVRQLLRAWKLFFYYHSSERHSVYQALYRDRRGLWPLLQYKPLPTAVQDSSSKFNTRLLSFAPEWGSDEESFADQQLICASMISIAALSQNIETSAPTSLLLPSVVIDWAMSTIGPPGLGRSTNGTNDPAIPKQTSPESGDAPFVLSSDELSLLFIVAHALNSQNINLTLLRVSLAKTVPENQSGRVMSIFSEFKSRVPDLLGHTVYEQGNNVKTLISNPLEHGVPAAVVTKAVSREPLDALLQRVIASQTIAEVDSLRLVYSSLRHRYPRAKLRDIQMAFYKKYCDLGSSDQQREFWNTLPMLDIPKDLWTLKLDFYFGRKDIAAFEDAWLGMTGTLQAASAEDWCKRLQLYFNCDRFQTALELFYFELLRVSGRGQRHYPAVFSPLARRAIVTIETYNLMIRNLLEIGRFSLAGEIESRLREELYVEANADTYTPFFSYYMKRSKTELAMTYLKKAMKASAANDFAPHFKFIQLGLQQWPREAPWADVHLVMERLHRGLGSRYFRHKILRKISLVADAYGGSYKITVSPTPGTDTLSFETEQGFADVLAEQIPMRADTLASPIMEALGANFVSLMSAITQEYPDPQNTRLMLIAWTYCRLQGLPILREVGDLLCTQLSQLSFQQQLRLLGGDVYQRSCSAGYGNFAYVRTHFGPEFVVRRLKSLGLGRYAPLIRKLPWLGFTSYNDQLLLKNGMSSARARTLFLDTMNDLYNDLKTIRKEAESGSPKRIATKEGIWYLSNAIVDDSGSLRKIPFTSWEAAPKREATKRFKLFAVVPKLLGGEMAMRRMKQRTLSKGRKSLTRGGKGLVARPLRGQLSRRRRRRHPRSPDDPLRFRISPDGNETIPGAEPASQQGHTALHAESVNTDADVGVKPFLKPGQFFRYKRYSHNGPRSASRQ